MIFIKKVWLKLTACPSVSHSVSLWIKSAGGNLLGEGGGGVWRVCVVMTGNVKGLNELI